jgi:hypothetical protein
MTENLTGSALYRAYADMLEGGRVVEMLHGSSYTRKDWVRADGIHLAYTYRFKPDPPRTVTLGYKNEYGAERWETLVAPEKVAPAARVTWFYICGDGSVDSSGGEVGQYIHAGNVFATRDAAQAMANFQRRARGCV